MLNGITPAALSALMNNDLGNFLVASTPGGIETQEKMGSLKLRNEELFPKTIMHSDKTHSDLEKEWGVKFVEIENEKDGDIFYKVKLPLGWSIKPASSSSCYWSNLVDNENRIRAKIFYKAAFYDRSSHAFICKELEFHKEDSSDVV